MVYILDTNVISELIKPKPNENVIRFFNELENAMVSVIVISEMLYGIEKLDISKKRQELETFLHDFEAQYADVIVPITSEIAKIAARLRVNDCKRGRTLAPMDALIAATAVANNGTLVTNNIKDFATLGIALLNPFENK